MNDGPFGFNPPGGDDAERPAGEPAGAGGFDMAAIGAMLQQLGQFLQSGTGNVSGSVNWDLASQVARNALTSLGDPAPTAAEQEEVLNAVDLADVWLDAATQFPAGGGRAEAWSRSAWFEATLPAWKQIVNPVAEQMAQAMQQLLPGGGDQPPGTGLPAGLPLELPAEMAAMGGPLVGMLRAMSSAAIGMQVGQGLVALAGEVLGAGDIGVPLLSDSRVGLVPANVEAFGSGLGLPADEVMLFVALREAAHQRLFAHVPWLRSRVLSSIEVYAAGIHIDRQRIEEAMGGMDPTDPASLQSALAEGVFEVEDSEQQRAALARLETILALVEGWVDDTVGVAASDRLPSYTRVSEVLRRRRATGGPAEKTFATLVGLELRPRRLRDAAALWSRLRADGGLAARDGLWGHPDLLPASEDLDDVEEFIERSRQDDSGSE
ncbi:MAG: zinc-dependent metalloprotease [Candidatus Nanopelagicales bacterium]|nr:zinc-dependent metalloprotease [Candidatus Nanopelagicales bacterium]